MDTKTNVKPDQIESLTKLADELKKRSEILLEEKIVLLKEEADNHEL